MRSWLKISLIWLCGLGVGLGAMVPLRAAASTDIPPATPPALACDAAGHRAERTGALPANLLVSIGVVESGRMDPATGRIAAWPWTVNVDGAGHYFADEQDAADFAQASEAAGARDVDVGCFQISLQHHPGAFASLGAAFDPAGNADFAAYFLNELKIQTGSWQAATADYHSALPALGLPYQRRVWVELQRFGNAPADVAAAFFTLADPSVILEAPAARLVRVITADGETGPAVRAWLPRVITP